MRPRVIGFFRPEYEPRQRKSCTVGDRSSRNAFGEVRTEEDITGAAGKGGLARRRWWSPTDTSDGLLCPERALMDRCS